MIRNTASRKSGIAILQVNELAGIQKSGLAGMQFNRNNIATENKNQNSIYVLQTFH